MAHHKFLTRRLFFFSLALALLMGIVSGPATSQSVEGKSSSNFSDAAQQARTYISELHGIPIEALIITTDHPTEYRSLARKFQVVALLDTRPYGDGYKMLYT